MDASASLESSGAHQSISVLNLQVCILMACIWTFMRAFISFLAAWLHMYACIYIPWNFSRNLACGSFSRVRTPSTSECMCSQLFTNHGCHPLILYCFAGAPGETAAVMIASSRKIARYWHAHSHSLSKLTTPQPIPSSQVQCVDITRYLFTF